MKEDAIQIEKEALKKGLLNRFNEICPSCFEIYILLCAYSPDGKKVSVDMRTLCEKSGYSLWKIVKVLQALERAKIIRKETVVKRGKNIYYLR